MPAINQPDDAGTIIADLRRRVERLESQPQLGSSQINAGSLTVTDAAGNILVIAGLLPNGSYGLQVQSDPAGPGVTFLADANGAALPFVVAPMRATGAGVTVTGTTMASIFRAEIELLQWDAVRVRVPWATGTATASLALIVENVAGVATSTVTLPASSAGTYDFRWLHGVPLNVGPVYFAVQAATSDAAQAVTVWPPDGGATFYRGADMTPPATAAGV